jgi:hypothetical protein
VETHIQTPAVARFNRQRTAAILIKKGAIDSMKLFKSIFCIEVFSLSLIIGIFGSTIPQLTKMVRQRPAMTVEEQPVQNPTDQIVAADTQDRELVPTADDSSIVYDISDLTGDYYSDIADDDHLGKPFTDFDHFEIETAVFDDGKGNYVVKPIAPRGNFYTKNKFKLERIAIGGSEIEFQTATVNGISYRFSGHIDNFPKSVDGGVPRLQGKLVMLKNGRRAGETAASFLQEDGC